eukprot:882389-Amphidinium_carterae.2
MNKTKHRKVATPKKDWLSARTWQGMGYLSDLRKYYALRQTSFNKFKFLLKVCLTAWMKLFLARHNCKKKIRKWQKEDRNEWLTKQCDQLNNQWAVDKKSFFAVLRNFRPRTPKIAPPHVLLDGTLASTPALHAEAQRQYWCSKLNATAMSADLSLTSEHVTHTCQIPAEALAEAEHLIPVAQVKNLLCKLNPRKVSPDLLAPSVMKELAPLITDPLRAHMVEVMATGRCPQSWRGSQLIGIPKKSSGEEVALRPISLLLTSAG